MVYLHVHKTLVKYIVFKDTVFFAFKIPQVNPDSLRPHVSDLLRALICCFKDDSWPVRDGEYFFI